MNKKMMIIGSAAALVVFAGTFAAAWLTGRRSVPAAEPKRQRARRQQQPAGATTTHANENMEPAPVSLNAAEEEQSTKGMAEKQFKSLVFEVREKIHDYEGKMKELEVREQRLQVTQDSLKKDIEELNRMRVETAALVVNLKEQRTRLLETRAQIAESEKANLTTIAATYDKMDPGSASKILSNMCAKQMETGRVEGGSVDDAVKILHYMTERTKAKLLGEMVTTEPKLAAVLCQRLKLITEGR